MEFGDIFVILSVSACFKCSCVDSCCVVTNPVVISYKNFHFMAEPVLK